jgi:hypothetical protein
MRFLAKDTTAISTLSLVILLLASLVIGAVLSYLWTVGYYIDKGFKVPEDRTTIAITNVTFPVENSTYFTVTVLNPSFSKGEANVTGLALVVTLADGETLQAVPAESIEPSTPYPIMKGEVVTFKCNKAWGAFAGQTVRVVVFLHSESGATFPYSTRNVQLEVARTEFETTVTVKRFNVTLRNSAESSVPLNVTDMLFDADIIPAQNITGPNADVSLPFQLQPGQNRTLTCHWDLLERGALGSAHTITARTVQGYSAVYVTPPLPQPVALNITEVSLNASDTARFNVTVASLPSSPHFVNISRVTITNGTETFRDIVVLNGIQSIWPSESVVLQCLWDWAALQDQEVTITVYTTQGFHTSSQKTFSPN